MKVLLELELDLTVVIFVYHYTISTLYILSGLYIGNSKV